MLGPNRHGVPPSPRHNQFQFNTSLTIGQECSQKGSDAFKKKSAYLTTDNSLTGEPKSIVQRVTVYDGLRYVLARVVGSSQNAFKVALNKMELIRRYDAPLEWEHIS